MTNQNKDDGGAAFPRTTTNAWDVNKYGMTLRDYFAAQAMAGLAQDWPVDENIENAAHKAYAIADAMLEARK